MLPNPTKYPNTHYLHRKNAKRDKQLWHIVLLISSLPSYCTLYSASTLHPSSGFLLCLLIHSFVTSSKHLFHTKGTIQCALFVFAVSVGALLLWIHSDVVYSTETLRSYSLSQYSIFCLYLTIKKTKVNANWLLFFLQLMCTIRTLSHSQKCELYPGNKHIRFLQVNLLVN